MKSFLDLDNKELKEIIEKKLNSKYLENEYYEGNQWNFPGISTKSGLNIIDKRQKGKNYIGFVQNITKDCVSSMKNLTKGISNEEFKTNNDEVNSFFKYININKKLNELITKLLVDGKVFGKIYKDNFGKLNFEIIKQNRIIYLEENEELKEVGLISQNGKDIQFVLYTKGGVYTFTNGKKTDEIGNELGIIPFVKFENEEGSYVKDLIDGQDILNIKITKGFEIDKFNSDPLMILKSKIDSKKVGELEFGSGSVLSIPETATFERLVGMGISKEFLEQIEIYKNDIYRIGKLSGLKNKDFFSGNISGFALKLSLTDTFSYVNDIRNSLKYGFYDLFELLTNFININLDEIEIYFPEILEMNYSELLDNANKLKLMEFSDEYIGKFIGLTEDEIKEELDRRDTKEVNMGNFGQLNEQLNGL